jgi:hypothetical protein
VPKVSGKILKTAEKDGKFAAWVQFSGRLPKIGEIVSIKWGKGRSNSQNAFLWLFYGWILEVGGLKDDFDTAEELHETMKLAFLSKKIFAKNGQPLTKIGSTTTLNKDEFSQFFEKVNKAVIEYYGVDTSQFLKDYEEFYSPHGN